MKEKFETAFFCVLVVLGVGLAALAAFHPFYFGDEIAAFGSAYAVKNAFWGTYSAFLSYKPRLLYNAIWAAITTFELPRFVPMAISVLGMAGIVLTVCWHASKAAGRNVVLCALLVVVLVANRFGFNFWYDYILATIETLSLLFFLTGLVVILSDEISERRKVVIATIAFLAAVMTHERYAIPVLTVCVLMAPLLVKKSSARIGLIAGGGACTMAIFCVHSIFSDQSILIGTANQKVNLGFDNIVLFLKNISNVFLQTGFGPEWFVGRFFAGGHAGRTVSIVLAVVFMLFWFRMVPRIYLTVRGDTSKKVKLSVIMMSMLALIAIASTVAPDREELRFVFPAWVLLVLFVVTIGDGVFVYVFCLLSVFAGALYISSGSLNSLAQISASRTARNIGLALGNVSPPGKVGYFIGGRDGAWAVGGNLENGGDVFLRANRIEGVTLKVVRDGARPSFSDADFVFYSSGRDAQFVPVFKTYSRQGAELLLNAESYDYLSDKSVRWIGDDAHWAEWTNYQNLQSSGVLELRPGVDSFFGLPAMELDGKALIYVAQAFVGENVPMRLQVNWHDAQGKFISASITVVSVGVKEEPYATVLKAPEGATEGLVYATLHDGAKGSVALSRVGIRSLM